MPLDESPDDRDTGQIGLGEDPAHRAIIEKLAKDSRRSSLVALVGGIVIVASFVGIYVSVLDYRKSNTSLQTNLDTTSAQADQDRQKAQAATQQVQAVKSVIAETVKNLQSSDPGAAAPAASALDKALNADPAAASLVVRVYIHTNSADQQKRANAIASALRSQGYIVPGVDQMPDVYKQGPKTYTVTQIHYYEADSVSLSDVAAIAAIVKDKLAIPVQTIQVAPSVTYKVRPRAYGLYVARDLK